MPNLRNYIPCLKNTGALALCVGVVMAYGVSASQAQEKPQEDVSVAIEKMPEEVNIDLIRFSLVDWDPKFVQQSKARLSYINDASGLRTPYPPKNSSDQTQKELNFLKSLELTRNPEVVAKIRADNAATRMTDIFEREGVYDPVEHPSIGTFVALTDRDVSAIILKEKLRHQRARPTQLREDLSTVVDVPKHSSYPSGHATQAYFTALAFAEADPKHAEQYLQVGIDIGYRREVAGIHYPSDSEAGRELAQKLFDRIMQDDKAQELMQTAKQEFNRS